MEENGSNKSTGTYVEDLAVLFKELKVDFNAEDISAWAVSGNADSKVLEGVESILLAIRQKGYRKRWETLRDFSGLPQVGRKTFDNYDFSVLTAQNRDAIMALKTLSFLKLGFNVIITGDTGTGKTHIAQALGNECLDHLVKPLFITLSSLKAKIDRAIKNGTVSAFSSNIVGVQCLIIDEIDKCSLNKEETAVLFDIVNRKCSTRGAGSIIVTANSQPSEWTEVFLDHRTGVNLLDRLYDKAYIFDFRGPSYRGKNRISTKVSFSTAPILPKVR